MAASIIQLLPDHVANQKQNQESKIPKDLQKLILERSANQEKETARKLLNKNAYSIPESNEKDW
jgi:DNA-dependent RNA polymerase auxiliary subunit epsilon